MESEQPNKGELRRTREEDKVTRTNNCLEVLESNYENLTSEYTAVPQRKRKIRYFIRRAFSLSRQIHKFTGSLRESEEKLEAMEKSKIE